MTAEHTTLESAQQELTMLRQEYAADTTEIAKLNAMLDEHREDLSAARQGWEQADEALRDADAEIAALKAKLEAAERDAERLDYLDADFGRKVLSIGIRWYWRKAVAAPIKRCASLREAIDAARHKQAA